MKEIVIATAKVFGATEANEGFEAVKTASKIFRSDNLTNLERAIKENDAKLSIAKDKLKINPPDTVDTDTIVGYDADHPFVTKELPAKKSDGTEEILRAWRYIAVVK